MKILQSELTFSLLCVENESQQYKIFEVPITCPLQSFDHTTSESLFAAWMECFRIPGLEVLIDHSAARYVLFSLDRASANIKAARAVAERLKFVPLRMPCSGHIVSTATCRSYNVIEGAISGMIAASLVLRNGGQAAAFRKALTEVIRSSVRCQDWVPQMPTASHFQTRDALLDFMLPQTAAGLTRKAVLQDHLHGDIGEEEMIWCHPGGTTPEQLDDFADKVSHALCPRSIDTFPRTRWLTSLKSVSQCGLLSMHGLLSRALLRFLAISERKRPPPIFSDGAIASTGGCERGRGGSCSRQG